VTKKLVKGGYFICTIPDANVMVKRMRERGKKVSETEYVLGNEFYSVRFESLEFPKDKTYGIKYGFFLDEAVGQKEVQDGESKITYVAEYLVIFENFVKLAKSYGLELVEHKNFNDFLKDNLKNSFYYNLFTKTVLSDFNFMEKQLWEVSYLYKAVVFRKVDGEDMMSAPRNF